MLIINELVRAGVINDLIARDAELSFTNGETATIDEALTQRGVSSEAIRAKRAEMYGLSEYDKEIYVDPESASLLPEEIVRRTKSLPIETVQKRDHVLVGIVDPEVPDALDILQNTFGTKNIRYRLVAITFEQFQKGLESYLNSQKTPVGNQSINLEAPNLLLEKVTKEPWPGIKVSLDMDYSHLQIAEWLNDNLFKEREHKQKQLWIWGPTGNGKTYLWDTFLEKY